MTVAKLLLARNESKRPLSSRRRSRARSPSRLGRAYVAFEVLGRDGAVRMTRTESQPRDTPLREFATYALLPRSVQLLWRGDLAITKDQVFGAGNHRVSVVPVARVIKGA